MRDVVAASPRARSLNLGVPGWPGHRAGQHVDLRLTAEDGYQAQRSYSIASAPEDATLQLTIVRVDDGEVSPYLLDELRSGDPLDIRGPVGGHFSWSVDEGGPLLLVGGGSGLVPLMAMVRHRAAHGSDAETRLLVSARSDDDLLYREELAALQPALQPADRLIIARNYTREPPAGWTGWKRRVDAAMLAALGAPPGSNCFVCGPTPFVEAVTQDLVAAGHEPRRIHAERFGPTGG